MIKKRENVRLKHCNHPITFIGYSNDIGDIYENIDDYNPNKKWKLLIIFNYVIADILSNIKLQALVTELFIKGRKLNIFLVFIGQPYLAVPKNIRLNYSNYFMMKITNKKELQQIANNHSSDIDFKHFMNLQKMHCKIIFFLSE